MAEKRQARGSGKRHRRMVVELAAILRLVAPFKRSPADGAHNLAGVTCPVLGDSSAASPGDRTALTPFSAVCSTMAGLSSSKSELTVTVNRSALARTSPTKDALQKSVISGENDGTALYLLKEHAPAGSGERCD